MHIYLCNGRFSIRQRPVEPNSCPLPLGRSFTSILCRYVEMIVCELVTLFDSSNISVSR